MKNKHFYSVVHFIYSVLQSTTVLHVFGGIPVVLLFIFMSARVELITSASMEHSFLGFARKDCTMLFWVQKMRLGVCISVYRIGKKVPPGGGALYELLYAFTKMLKIQCFLSLCALVDYQCTTSIFNCMQRIAFRTLCFCAMRVCANLIHLTNWHITINILSTRKKVKKFSRKHLTRAKHVLY